MSHYKILGVAEGATADEIKQAYRKKAVTSHPDKGGSPDDFVPIAKAYEVLSDPERRLLYDATGEERRLPIEQEVQGVLMQLFNQALAQEGDIEIVAFVRNHISTQAKQIPGECAKLNRRKEKLEAKRGKISSDAPVNMVHLIIDSEIKNIEGQLLNFEHQAALGEACLAALDLYSEEWEAPPPQMFTMSDLRRQYDPTRITWK